MYHIFNLISASSQPNTNLTEAETSFTLHVPPLFPNMEQCETKMEKKYSQRRWFIETFGHRLRTKREDKDVMGRPDSEWKAYC